MPNLFHIGADKIQENKEATAKATAGLFNSIIIRIKIKILEQKKIKYYIKIGKKYYMENLQEHNIMFDSEMEALDKLQSEIEQLKEKCPIIKLSSSDSNMSCPNCKKMVSTEDIYCPCCGTKLKDSLVIQKEENILEIEDKPKISIDIDKENYNDDYFDPMEEGADETVKKDLDDEINNFFDEINF